MANEGPRAWPRGPGWAGGTSECRRQQRRPSRSRSLSAKL